MNQSLPAIIVSFLAPGLVLMLVLGAVARWLGLGLAPSRIEGATEPWKGAPGLPGRWCAGLALISFLLLITPMRGLPLARWLAGIVDHWSVPLLAVITSAVGQQFFGIEFLRRQDRRAAWAFEVVAGLVLYPLALGWGPFDPYSLGWRFGPLFGGMGALAATLLWKGNRFGVVLVFAIIAWYLGVPESGNYWDCLVDPLAFVASLIALGWGLRPAKRMVDDDRKGSSLVIPAGPA